MATLYFLRTFAADYRTVRRHGKDIGFQAEVPIGY